jgi:aminoglycoside phosphotransferase (APT) family kinase protein
MYRAVPHWERAAAVVAGGPPAAPRGFLHRDHHPMNVLWSDGAISGVVDWVNACAGPLPVDLAHCRVNVAAMYGVDAAEVLRQEWERLSADAYDPMWDLFTLLSMVPLEPYPAWATAVLVVSQADVELRLGNLLRHSLAEIGG